MAEMTAAEAIRMALKFNQFDVAGVITCMTTQLDGMKQKESAYKQVIESKKALIEQQAQEIERLNKSLQYEQHRTGRQGTHAEGCYKWGPGHWDCAMREIERMAPVITAAREYDTICAQIHAMTEPIPGYMLDVARKARLSLSEALMRMDAAISSAPAGEDAP